MPRHKYELVNADSTSIEKEELTFREVSVTNIFVSPPSCANTIEVMKVKPSDLSIKFFTKKVFSLSGYPSLPFQN